MPRRQNRILPLIGVIALLGLTMSPGVLPDNPFAMVQPDSVGGAPSQGPSTGTPRSASVVTIGDSIMSGHGVGSDEAWVSLVAVEKGWHATNLAEDGAGFLAIGDNGNTFADEARAAVTMDPDLIVIGGSSNDFGADDTALEAATLSTISYLHAALPNTEIIGLSTVWGSDNYPDQLLEVNSQVNRAVVTAHGIYLDIAQPIADGTGLLQPDEIHPTSLGQRLLATAISAALTKAGVVY